MQVDGSWPRSGTKGCTKPPSLERNPGALLAPTPVQGAPKSQKSPMANGLIPAARQAAC